MKRTLTKTFAFSLFAVALTCLISNNLGAQTTYTIGTGTTANTATGYPTPYGNWFWGNRLQVVYRASELSAAGASAGLISSISFNITNLNSLPALDDFEIKIKNDTVDNLDNGWVSGMTTVFTSTSYPPPTSTGWNTHTFTSPFMWDGVSNIIVEICSQNNGWTGSGNASVQWTENLPAGSSRTYRADATGVCSNTLTSNQSPTNRPNAQFVITSGPCTAPPTAGTATGPDSVCLADPVNISLSGSTGGTGQSFQWQSSPDGVNWTTLANDTLPGLSTNISSATYFRCYVTCSNQTDTSTATLVNVKPVADCYCPSTATSTTYGYIQQVELGSINQMSPVGCGQQYTDYTDSGSTNLIASVNYPISIDVQGCSGGSWTHSTKVWIDFNQNGSFLDPGEEILVESPHQYGLVTGNFTVPTTNIVPGPTIMRVVTVETGVAASVTPCGTYTWGETEDYTVVIIADTCTSPVFIGNLQASEPQVCPGVPSTITAPNMSMGITQSYQWQVSIDSITWTDITGATATQYTATSNEDRYYRLKSACQGDTTISDPIKITIDGDPLRGTYTINQLAAPSATNFSSFSDFVDALSCGGVDSAVIVNVAPGSGPYNEQIMFDDINGSSPTNTITINGNGVELQFTATETNERYTLALNETSYLTIDSLRIVALGSGTDFGWGVWVTNGAHHNTVKNSEIIVDTSATNTNFGGIIMSSQANSATPFSGAPAGSYNTFENNLVFGGYYGVTAMANNISDQSVGNQFINNRITDFRFYGMYFRAQDSLIVKGNEVTRGNRYVSGFATFFGMYFTSGFTNNTIEGNWIYNSCEFCDNVTSAQYAVYFTGASGTTGNTNLFANNLIHDINGDGSAFGIYAFTNNFWRYYHNTIVMDGTASSPNTWAVYSSGNTGDSEFVNNIISVDKSGNAIGFNFPTGTNTIGCDYNGVYVPNGNVGRLGITNYASLADWQTQGFDANSQEAPPLFVDPAAFDYTPGTPAFDQQGINLLADVPNDFFGVARTTTPDFGAIEYIPVGCAGPFGFGNDSLTPNSGFFSWDSYETDWVVEWGPIGFLPGSAIGNQVASTNNTLFEVTGFSSNTCYHVFVAEVCNGDTSEWTGPITICTPKAHDAALLGIVDPSDRDCGENPMDINVELRNNAYNPITSVPITVEISGDFTQTINFTYSGNLPTDSSEVVTVGSIDFSNGGLFSIVAYVDLPNDEDSLNDTASVMDINIIPEEPRFDNLPFCAGDDSVTVFGYHMPQILSYGWYDAATGGTRIGNSDTITVAASLLPNLWLGYDSVPNTPGNRNYCTANATATTYGYIQNVTFGSINQTSPVGCGQQYTDYTDSASTAVNPGQTLPISIEIAGCTGTSSWTHSTKVYIDFNGNGDFTDPGEEVLVESPHQYGVITGNIVIPMSATPGLTTTMRVVTVETAAAASVNPCGTFTWGEVEDYTIEILGAVACSPNRTQVDITGDSVPVASFTYTELPNLDVQFINTSTPSGTIANWDFGPLGTATGDTVTITYPQTGDFTVCLEASNFCSSDNTCETVAVNGIGVETFAVNNLKLFPNPNEGVFTLTFTQDFISDVAVELIDVSGKTVYTELVETFSGEYSKRFDKSNVAAGAYMLRIRNSKGSAVRSVIVNK